MKHLLLIGLSSITVFLASSPKLGKLPTAVEIHPVEVNVIAATVPTAKIWVESPAVFYKNETIELRFAAPNAPFLGVVDPSGHFFYLVYPKEQATGSLKPLVDSAHFIEMSSLKINTSTFKADPYTYGVSKNQPVFTKSGKYTFILGENLHVDDPELLDQLVIEYIHASRQSKPLATVAMN